VPSSPIFHAWWRPSPSAAVAVAGYAQATRAARSGRPQRNEQLLAEADKLRHALAALDPRAPSTAKAKTTRSQPTAKRAAKTPDAPKQTSARTRARTASTANGASASTRTPPADTKATVLAALSSDQALTAGEVANATGLARPTVSTTLSKLSKTGQVIKADRGYRLPAPTAGRQALPDRRPGRRPPTRRHSHIADSPLGSYRTCGWPWVSDARRARWSGGSQAASRRRAFCTLGSAALAFASGRARTSTLAGLRAIVIFSPVAGLRPVTDGRAGLRNTRRLRCAKTERGADGAPSRLRDRSAHVPQEGSASKPAVCRRKLHRRHVQLEIRRPNTQATLSGRL
jgi:DNA-binding transcriptional ArsR family regulator